jgi:hypothetical protein
MAARAQLVLDEVVAQSRRNRDSSSCRATLRSDDTFLGVPGALDVNHAPGQVDVLPPQREQRTAT